MLSLLSGCLKAFAYLAEVIPYTILIIIFKAYDKFLDLSLSKYGAKAPPNIFLALSKSLCFIASLAFTRSLNLSVYLPKALSCIAEFGCMDAISNRPTL